MGPEPIRCRVVDSYVLSETKEVNQTCSYILDCFVRMVSRNILFGASLLQTARSFEALWLVPQATSAQDTDAFLTVATVLTVLSLAWLLG